MNVELFVKRKPPRQTYDSKRLAILELNFRHILPWIIHRDRKSSGWLYIVFICSYCLCFAWERVVLL